MRSKTMEDVARVTRKAQHRSDLLAPAELRPTLWTHELIPISKPSLGSLENSLVLDALQSGWISSKGPYIEQFEEAFAEYCGTRHCIAVANGTVGLHLALAVFGITSGDEVIVPDLTFVATASAVRYTGATPVFADIDPDTWCLDPADIAKKLTKRTKAIIPVHLYGHPAPMREINELAKKNGLIVVEDAAEAHGAEYHGKRVGALGDVGVFSFYGNKIITTGEGGALTTDSDEWAERAKFLRDHAMDRNIRYWHTDVGFNYRMTNIQAAIGVAQLRQIEPFINERREILEHYRRHLRHTHFRLNPETEGMRPVNWMTSVYADSLTRATRDELLAKLHSVGVDSRPFFYPITALPMYEGGPNPVSARVSSGGLNLPTYIGLTGSDIAQVCTSLISAFDS